MEAAAERSGFRDRREAGEALADELARLPWRACVVAAIPRGGVVVAAPIARRLRAPLTCVYVRKLTAPGAPEVAFGALDEDGQAVTDRQTVAALGLHAGDVERIKERVAGEISRRRGAYPVRPLAHHLPGAAVVLVDDGLATGLTVEAALRYARCHGASEVTVATPCASAEAARRLRREADRFVSLIVDEAFAAVGEYYGDFSPVADEEVVRMLVETNAGEERRARAEGLGVSFKSPTGLRLAGELLVPEGPGPHPAVVVAGAGVGGRASPESRALAQTLWAEGLATFLFDWTGCGESEGDRAQSTPAQQLEDLRAAVEALGAFDEVDGARVSLAALGSGVAAATRVVGEGRRIRALVLFTGDPEAAAAGAPPEVPVLRLTDAREAARAASWLRKQVT